MSMPDSIPNSKYTILVFDLAHPHVQSNQVIIGIRGASYLLDVVVAQSAAILELLASKDQALLVRGDTLLVLDLGLDVVDGVARLDVEGNGLTRQGLDETKSSPVSPNPSCRLVGDMLLFRELSDRGGKEGARSIRGR